MHLFWGVDCTVGSGKKQEDWPHFIIEGVRERMRRGKKRRGEERRQERGRDWGRRKD